MYLANAGYDDYWEMMRVKGAALLKKEHELRVRCDKIIKEVCEIDFQLLI